MGWMPSTILYTSRPAALVTSAAPSIESMPYSASFARTCFSLLSYDSITAIFFVPPLLLFARVNNLYSVSYAAVLSGSFLQSSLGVVAVLDEIHHSSEVHILVADDLIVLIQSDAGYIAFCHLQVAGALLEGSVHGSDLGTKSLAQILQTRADGQTFLGEGALGTSVNDLQEQLSHSSVDGVAYQVSVQSFHDGQAGKDLRSHGCGMGHAGAAQSLYQSLLDDSVFYIQSQLAGSLLGRAPANTVSQAGNIFYFLSFYPFCLFRNRSCAMMNALMYRTHHFYLF